MELSGSYADYRITRLGDTTLRVVDTHAGRDGADVLKNIEKLNFADVTAVMAGGNGFMKNEAANNAVFEMRSVK